MLTLAQGDAGRTVALDAGAVIELRLAENPSTGFRWELAADGRPACLVVDDRFVPDSDPPGAGGERHWQIRGVAQGDCTILLRLRRRFEHVPPAQSFAVHIVVSDQSGAEP